MRAVRRLPMLFRTEGALLIGNGRTVTLAPGWTVRPGVLAGDVEIVRQP